MIKFNLFVHNKIKASRVWVELHDINSHDVTNVGWLFNLHAEHYSKSAIKQMITQLLPENLQNEIQLNVKTIPYFLDRKTYTRGYVLEMDRKLSAEYSTMLFEKLSPTSKITLVPYNSGLDVRNTIQKYF